jgi:hypothetical protein
VGHLCVTGEGPRGYQRNEFQYNTLPAPWRRRRKVVQRLLCVPWGLGITMLRIIFGVTGLCLLLLTYWVHPTTAWVVLGSSFTLAIANRVRQRDEAEGALQTTEE